VSRLEPLLEQQKPSMAELRQVELVPLVELVPQQQEQEQEQRARLSKVVALPELAMQEQRQQEAAQAVRVPLPVLLVRPKVRRLLLVLRPLRQLVH